MLEESMDHPMILPSREPRNEPSLEAYTYYDHEDVVQADGRMSCFTWNNKQGDRDWIFDCYKDKYGFSIRKLSTEMNSLILDNTIVITDMDIICFGLTKDELIEMIDYYDGYGMKIGAYEYGGIMSMRSGLFVVTKIEPLLVIGLKGILMS